MLCPNCRQPLQQTTLDKQSVLHCTNCGCSFFEENGINRIRSATATLLAANKRVDEASGSEKLCPKDNIVLEAITNDKAIPDGVTLLRCPRCFGILAFPEDLAMFKNAQDTKLRSFKKAHRPLPALSAIIVLAFLAAASFSVVTSLDKKQASQVKATSIVKRVDVLQSGSTTIITFTTSQPVQSMVQVTDSELNKKLTRSVSSGLATTHIFTTGLINTDHTIRFKIMFFDRFGKKISETEMYSLNSFIKK